jgi:hypothetical protein
VSATALRRCRNKFPSLLPVHLKPVFVELM